MKTTLVIALLFSSIAFAAPDMERTVSSTSSKSSGKTINEKKQEPSSFPCTPQKTRGDKLNDLAKLEGQGESHSTNCPAQGTIKDETAKPQ